MRTEAPLYETVNHLQYPLADNLVWPIVSIVRYPH